MFESLTGWKWNKSKLAVLDFWLLWSIFAVPCMCASEMSAHERSKTVIKSLYDSLQSAKAQKARPQRPQSAPSQRVQVETFALGILGSNGTGAGDLYTVWLSQRLYKVTDPFYFQSIVLSYSEWKYGRVKSFALSSCLVLLVNELHMHVCSVFLQICPVCHVILCSDILVRVVVLGIVSIYVMYFYCILFWLVHFCV